MKTLRGQSGDTLNVTEFSIALLRPKKPSAGGQDEEPAEWIKRVFYVFLKMYSSHIGVP